jgi:hypothetical protein
MSRSARSSISAALAAFVTLAALMSAAAGARAATAAQTIALLNAQRAANGIPAGITEDATLSTDCAEHDHYMFLNHQLTHQEQPGNPGYTAGGAYAGLNAVLTENDNWDAGDPYENAPLHLDQLLAPRLLVLGTADVEGFSCTTTFPGWVRPDPLALTVYTYPGNGAQIYASEIARELPWTPGQLVGLAPGARTGPYLFVLVDAPGQSPVDNPATLSGATLTGPSGQVMVATVDGTVPVPGNQTATLSSYISPGGFIIPFRPLYAGVTYHAHIVVGFAGTQTPYDWWFTTLGASPHSVLSARNGKLYFTSSSSQPVSVTFTRAGGRHAHGVTIAPGRSVRLGLHPGTWQACGHQPGTAGFAPFDGCIAIIVTGKPTVQFGTPRVAGSLVKIRVTFTRILRGRTARLTFTPLTVRCHRHGCSATAGRTTRRTITLRATALAFALPAHRHGFALALDTAAFQLGDAPWSAAHATVRFVRR